MADLRVGDRARVTKYIKVAELKKVITDDVVVDAAGNYYNRKHWDVERCNPENWPPLPGDVWEVAETHSSTLFFCQGYTNDKVKMIPMKSFDGHPIYSDVTSDNLRGYEDFKLLNPVLKFREAK